GWATGRSRPRSPPGPAWPARESSYDAPKSPGEKVGMKVFLSSDMEGTAGIVDWAQCVGDGPEAAAGRRLLLAEVNAAIEGALAGGAAEGRGSDPHPTKRKPPP